MKLDRIDRRILTEMQHDGRISNLELAERVGLSPTPCSRRVKQLEEAGIIEKHVTLLNPTQLNLKLIALIQISMDRHTPDRFENFQSRVAEFPEVIECSLITGQTADYLVKVVVPDMDAYQDLLLGRITRIAGVSGVQSSFVMRQIINKTELPLDYLD
ncbi:Lrp/AsnC family transcriptional regulator [Sedimenticola sp.]|uniref:Lrp/AsnC family transcriptional regulator n=1 Tax=Sedimenticola sp. TaxID=1940285 RepID=UPI003D139A83